jgi:hypothetical protein
LVAFQREHGLTGRSEEEIEAFYEKYEKNEKNP